MLESKVGLTQRFRDARCLLAIPFQCICGEKRKSIRGITLMEIDGHGYGLFLLLVPNELL